MNHHEKYFFDVRGYLVVRDALTADQVAALSEQFDRVRAKDVRRHYGSDRTRLPADADRAWSAATLLQWGGPYIDLIDLPTIAPYLEELLGVGYRLDHDYLAVNNAEDHRSLYLHGGGQGAGGDTTLVGPTDGGQCYYRYNNGKFYNGLIAVAFELNTVQPGDGGFACVAGSHKANFELPPDWKNSATQDEFPEVVDSVAVGAGDAIIFTEALAHGTVPWEGPNERRTIFYKYTPHAVAWSPCYYNADHYGDLSDRQRAMLMPPSAYGPDERTRAIWNRAQAEQAELVRLREEVAALNQQRHEYRWDKRDSGSS